MVKKIIGIIVLIFIIALMLFYSIFIFKKTENIKEITKESEIQEALKKNKTGVALCILLKENYNITDIDYNLSDLGIMTTKPYQENIVYYIPLINAYTTKGLTNLVETISKCKGVDKAFLDFYMEHNYVCQ